MGAAGAVPAALPELMDRLLAQGKIGLFLDLMTHRSKPAHVFTPPRLLGATGRLLARNGADRRAVLREFGSLIATDAHRKLLNHRRAYAAAGQPRPAEPTFAGGPTEPITAGNRT